MNTTDEHPILRDLRRVAMTNPGGAVDFGRIEESFLQYETMQEPLPSAREIFQNLATMLIIALLGFALGAALMLGVVRNHQPCPVEQSEKTRDGSTIARV